MFLFIVIVLFVSFIVSSLYLDLRQFYPRAEWCIYNCSGCDLCEPDWHVNCDCGYDVSGGYLFSGETKCFLPESLVRELNK